MGRNSSGGGGARGGSSSAGSNSTSSSAASNVSASVAGYSDLVTPRGVKISAAGTIKLTQPKTVEQANKMVATVQKAHDIAVREQKAVSSLPANDPKRVATSLRVHHTSQQLARAIKMAKKVLGS